MDIFLNGVKIDDEEYGTGDLKTAVEGILDRREEQVLTRAKLDGEEIDPGALLLGEGSVGDPERVELWTQGLGDLVSETLEEAKDYLPRLQAGLVQVAKSLQNDEPEEAKRILNLCLDGLEWYVEALEGILELTGDEELKNEGQTLLGELISLMEEGVESTGGGDRFEVASGTFAVRAASSLENFIDLNARLSSFWEVS